MEVDTELAIALWFLAGALGVIGGLAIYTIWRRGHRKAGEEPELDESTLAFNVRAEILGLRREAEEKSEPVRDARERGNLNHPEIVALRAEARAMHFVADELERLLDRTTAPPPHDLSHFPRLLGAAIQAVRAHDRVVGSVTPGHDYQLPPGPMEGEKKDQYDARFSSWHAAMRRLSQVLMEGEAKEFPPEERVFVIAESDLRDFAKQIQAATMITMVTLYDLEVGSAEAADLGNGLANFWQQHQGWLNDRQVGPRPLTDADRVQQEVHKGDLDY